MLFGNKNNIEDIKYTLEIKINDDLLPCTAKCKNLGLTFDSHLRFEDHQVEAQFSINKIKNDRTKYDYVVSALPLEVIAKVYDVIENLPQSNLYENLKETILTRLTASEEQRLEALLSGSELGDRKPSDFFRDMSINAGGSGVVSNELLIKLWKRRLPKTIIVAITASGKTQVNDILDIADKIWETCQDRIINVNANTTD
ncbi:hypothetical protein NQ315_012244 [Exocentrus adspersus]|uniref:DUF7041 domain-containing protein n=1 Tax=Exocentrus adspersus TaxID=1586481 RepID=A0AAV8VEY0_9CUCU|nr:hypothetical protein NQ315_012244 [Exocentrus adspersus]